MSTVSRCSTFGLQVLRVHQLGCPFPLRLLKVLHMAIPLYHCTLFAGYCLLSFRIVVAMPWGSCSWLLPIAVLHGINAQFKRPGYWESFPILSIGLMVQPFASQAILCRWAWMCAYSHSDCLEIWCHFYTLLGISALHATYALLRMCDFCFEKWKWWKSKKQTKAEVLD